MSGFDYEWCVSDVVRPAVGDRFACVLLNRPLTGGEDRFVALWNGAAVRFCVDGGANVLRALSADGSRAPAPAAPHLVCGDLDSITAETRRHYASLCPLVVTADQDETDFTKALRLLGERLRSEPAVSRVLAVADCSGRLDQTLANLSTLLRTRQLLGADTPVHLLAGDSVSWSLAPGRHQLRVPTDSEWCALVPLAGPVDRVTTSGLQWNLNGSGMQMGALISTSNRCTSDTVTVHTSGPLLFSIHITQTE